MKSDEILIIQYPYRMSQQRVDALREQILKQKETGVILLSDLCTVMTKPKDTDIQVELEKEDEITPWDFIDNNNYSPFDSQGKERLIFCTNCGCNVEHYDAQYQYCPYCGKRHYFNKTEAAKNDPLKKHCLSCKSCDPYGCGASENHGHCFLNGKTVNLDDVACEHYMPFK